MSHRGYRFVLILMILKWLLLDVNILLWYIDQLCNVIPLPNTFPMLENELYGLWQLENSRMEESC
jgi:hypothetical protein